MSNNVIFLAAGGSGGHVFPAQALAEVLLQRGWDVFLITDRRGLEFTRGFSEKVEKIVLKVKNPSSGGIYSFVLSIWLLFWSVIAVIRFCRKLQPSFVIGFGGYPSAPSMVAAQILKIPSVIHEQNAVLGRVNRIFRKRVKFLAFGLTPYLSTDCTENVIISGNPVRKFILESNRKKFTNNSPGKFKILVLGGSQDASLVSELVYEAIIKLPEKIRKRVSVIHQCRKDDIRNIEEKYSCSSVDSMTKAFFENVFEHFNAANLVISRAGASTLAELCIFGRPSILIPLPTAVGNHQALNAGVMEAEGAAIVMDQTKLTAKKLTETIGYLINDKKRISVMANSALKLGKPNAADVIANELEKLNPREKL